MTISPTLALNIKSKSLEQVGQDIYKFGFGQSPFPVPQVVVQALEANAYRKEYTPTQGIAVLREAIATYYHREEGKTISADQVVLAPGSKELLYLIQMALDRDLILSSPSWVSYAPQSRMIKKRVTWLSGQPNRDWEIDSNQLSDISDRPSTLVVNYPNNPTGRIWSRASMIEVAKICDRKGHIVISDEIYGSLTFDQDHRSISSIYEEGTIITGGLSKWCGAGGWRLGYAIFPEALSDIRDKVISYGSEVYSCVNTPVQYAAITAFSDLPELRTYKERARYALAAISRYMTDQLRAAEVQVSRPQGGFYAFPSFDAYAGLLKARGINGSEEMCHRILEETGVALLPGTAFGRPFDECSARLAFVDFDGAVMLEALAGQSELTDNDIMDMCPKITEGLERLGGWFEA